MRAVVSACFALASACAAHADPVLEFEARGEVMEIALSDIEGAQRSTDSSGGEAVMVLLGPDAAPRFTRFTRDNVGETVGVLVCGEVVIRPRLLTPIEGGRVLVTVGDAASADRIAEVLRGERACP